MGRYRTNYRIKGQRKLKANAPTAKFTLTKTFEVTNGAAHSSVYMKRIQCASPFGIFHDCLNSSGATLGNWDPNDDLNMPIGLDSDLYKNYNYCVVKGCHVSVGVQQAPDVAIPADSADPGSKQTMTTGQVTLARTADLLDTANIPTTAEMKTWFGKKTKNFQLGNNIAFDQALTRNANVVNGYSAAKQWNVNPNTRFDLQCQNNTAEEQDVDDPTHMYIIIKPRKDIDPSELPIYLKPMLVSVRVSYIIQFQDPTNAQSVPLPISTGSKAAYNKRNFKKKYTNFYTNATMTQKLMSAAAVIAAAQGGRAGYRRLRNRRERRVGFVNAF